MAKIEPNMLCLVKKDGAVLGMVNTIRTATETDPLPPTEGVAWLCEALSSMRAQRVGTVLGYSFVVDTKMMSPGTEGWVSECYLHPLPGLDDDVDTDTVAPKEKELDLVS